MIVLFSSSHEFILKTGLSGEKSKLKILLRNSRFDLLPSQATNTLLGNLIRHDQINAIRLTEIDMIVDPTQFFFQTIWRKRYRAKDPHAAGFRYGDDNVNGAQAVDRIALWVRQCVKASSGNSIPNMSPIGVFMIVLFSSSGIRS